MTAIDRLDCTHNKNYILLFTSLVAPAIVMFRSTSSSINKIEQGTHIDSVKVTGRDGDLLLDFSKNLVNEDVMKLLFDLVSTLYTE